MVKRERLDKVVGVEACQEPACSSIVASYSSDRFGYQGSIRPVSCKFSLKDGEMCQPPIFNKVSAMPSRELSTSLPCVVESITF